MGKRGPPKTPTPILQMRGSWRAKARNGEPQPEPGAPEKPLALSAEAERAWDELMPRLEAAGVATEIDGRAFARYCELWATWLDVQAFLAKSGHAHPTKNGKGEVTGVKLYPQSRLMLQVSEHLLRLEQQFGLTPAARANLATGGATDEDDASPFAVRLG